MKIHAFTAEGADPAYCEWSTDGDVIKGLYDDAIACSLFDTRNMVRFEMEIPNMRDFNASFANAVKSGKYVVHQTRPALAACAITHDKSQPRHRDVISHAHLYATYSEQQASNDCNEPEQVAVAFAQRRENRTQAMAYSHAH